MSNNGMDPARRLESRLAAYLGRRHCCVTGCGATAIYLALLALRRGGGKVILPDVLCPSPANVTLYAGFEPLFCDVSRRDCNMDPAALGTLLGQTPDVAAVVPVHLYGEPAAMAEILDLAAVHGVPVIEDAAQAMGGEYRGQKLGSFGDLSVVSFGHTKILDVGFGGAVLTDDEELDRRIREEAEALPLFDERIPRMQAEYRKVYYALRSLADTNERLHELFTVLPSVYREMYLFRATNAQVDGILRRLDDLDSVARVRRENAARYHRSLRHPLVQLPPLSPEAVPWRFSFLLREDRQTRVSDRLRAAGLDASNWYPPLHRWYASGRGQDPRTLANAEYVGRRVVNLWVEPGITTEYIDRACTLVLDELNEG